ncbi:MAG: four helix bundle suffix domain-containing protein [Rikenellaceae bacterium]
MSYKKATIIYDGTVYFCKKYLSMRDRTVDQMVQAARSGKQNIVEGNLAGATSKETEIKLFNVARASLGELLIDYEDFSRVNKITIWDNNHRLKQRLVELNRNNDANYETFRKAIENQDVEIVVNTMIFLIQMTMYLLYKHLQFLEKDFIEQGGIRERMTSERKKYRGF